MQIWLSDDLKQKVSQKLLRLQGELGREIAKNREFWPVVIEKGLGGVSADDFS